MKIGSEHDASFHREGMPRMKKPFSPKTREKGPAAPARLKALPPRTQNAFPIAGIGASAGGLEALELFLKHVPEGSDMAFVIVQHLDPTHKGIMVELLQRSTRMPVVQVKDRQKVAPNHVYVIPPNKDLSILHGVLHLLKPDAPRGLRLPIDFFFRSLADDCQTRSIGVILSGMGSDGTLGLRAIKEKAGVALVQAPDSAKFNGMPRSAIDAGLADVVAPAEELPGRIIDYLKHAPLIADADLSRRGKTQSALEKVCILLRAQTGHDFSLYKKSTTYRRIERRMGLHQIDKIATYVRLLRENSQEIELLFKELLIGVTSFFRDPPAWEQLKDEVVPALLAAHPKGGVLRAWTCGCSTGEEAYSLAIVFKEALERAKPTRNVSLQVFATDLDRDAIDRARGGVYPANIAADMSTERLRRFFVPDELGYRVGKEIREMVIFAPQNVLMDPPFTKLDVLVCRNLLIYLDQVMQKKLTPLFHYSLNPGGVLFLGSAETIGAHSDLFAPLAGKMRFYRRLETLVRTEPVEFPSSFFPDLPDAAPAQLKERALTPNLQTLADQLVLQRFSPAAVLTNEKGDILYINGRTGKYLEPAAGKANWNLFAMAREEVQSGREEMQTSQEELKSTNEELQSTNEELQSTNEELTTSKEEMQSLNEELQTVNQELQAKVDELSQANNDMKNLLNSTDIATLFLDDALNVRRFTTQTASIIKLITGDVGRPSPTSPPIYTTPIWPRMFGRCCGAWSSSKSRLLPETDAGFWCASCPTAPWRTGSRAP
jgi:two-component system CheB/CheR fusion protein